ncbi:hypothetical protein D3C75_1206350 [compost metagenome]
MPQLFQGLQARPSAICILAVGILADDELVGLRRIEVELLPLQAQATQHRDFRLDIRPGPAGALDLGQLKCHPFAIAPVVGAVGVVQMVVHRPTGAADDTGCQG